jgi:hypothetical protein
MKGNGRKIHLLKIKTNILLLFLFFLAAQHLGCDSSDFSQNKGKGAMKVKVVSLEKFSATLPTIALVEDVANEMGLEINLEHKIVKTREDAVSHRHIGSPTVQIAGLDIDPGARYIKQFGIT